MKREDVKAEGWKLRIHVFTNQYLLVMRMSLFRSCRDWVGRIGESLYCSFLPRFLAFYSIGPFWFRFGLCIRLRMDRYFGNPAEQFGSVFLATRRLLTQAEFSNDLLIPVAILAGKIFEQLVAAADELQQSAARGVIFLVRVEMIAQLSDPLSEQSDLDFRRAGVLVVNLEILDDFAFLFDGNRH